MGLEQIVNVNITRETASVTQAGFGTPLILGPNAAFANTAPRTYESLLEVADDFDSSDDEYKAAQKIFSSNPKVKQIKIGKRLANVAQVRTITPTAVNNFQYDVTIDGVLYSYTSDGSATVSEIVAGLIALINADVNAVVTASGSTTLILTADNAGRSFSSSVGTNLAQVSTTANVGVGESLAGISSTDDDWYGLIITSKSDGDVLEAAAYIEAVRKIFGISRSDAEIYDASETDDIFSKLMNANYFRTFTFYSGDAANFPEAGMFGRFLPTVPGSEQWAFKTYAGVTIDVLSSTQISALKGKNVNFYTRVAGVSVSQEGKTAGGEWIDTIRLIDLLVARMQEAIFGSLVRNLKIPFTNAGVSVIENDVRGVLSQNQKTGGIAPDEVDPDTQELIPGFTTSFPRVADVPANDRAARRLTGGTWTARLAGAIVAADINGTVTV